MDDKLTIFIALTAVAILIQAGVLLACTLPCAKAASGWKLLRPK